MDLFKIEGNLVIPTEHALLIYPFSEIWDRDPDPEKKRAKLEYAYIELNCSRKKSNPYKGLSDEARPLKVAKVVFREDYATFVEDDLIKECFKEYDALMLTISPTLPYYYAAKQGAEKMIKWLKDFDMTQKNPRNGMPLYKPREITSALKDSYDVMKTLNAMEEKVFEQIFEVTKTKSNKETNYFEK